MMHLFCFDACNKMHIPYNHNRCLDEPARPAAASIHPSIPIELLQLIIREASCLCFGADAFLKDFFNFYYSYVNVHEEGLKKMVK